MSPNRFSHLAGDGTARMVDVGCKPVTRRSATAEGTLHCSADTIRLLRKRAIPKGDVLTIAQIAGIQAAKSTAALIPLCHSIAATSVQVAFAVRAEGIDIRATVQTRDRTGAEMEALTAVSVAALAIYDVCKAVDKGMTIGGIRVAAKEKR